MCAALNVVLFDALPKLSTDLLAIILKYSMCSYITPDDARNKLLMAVPEFCGSTNISGIVIGYAVCTQPQAGSAPTRIDDFAMGGSYAPGSLWGGCYGLAIGADDTIWVCDQQSIFVFDCESRKFLRSLRQGKSSSGIAFVNGKVFVIDKHTIAVCSLQKGKNITKFGAYGSGLGQFNGPWQIAANGKGLVFVSDTNNNRVQVFDGTGGFVRAWGDELGRLLQPTGIAVDGERGEVYVGDFGNRRIQVFDVFGRFLRSFGSNGSASGQFRHSPRGLALDRDGNLLVADNGNNRVQIFQPDGTFITQVNNYYTDYVCVDRQGFIYVSGDCCISVFAFPVAV